MKLNEYQSRAYETAQYPKEVGLAYVTMGLAGEAGEIANKVKKIYRDKGGRMDGECADSLAKELGDVLWYVAMVAKECGYSLETVANMNVKKLASRHERGVIGGEGDDR